MIQGKSHHAESRAKTRKASAAQNRIQGKTTAANALSATGKGRASPPTVTGADAGKREPAATPQLPLELRSGGRR